MFTPVQAPWECLVVSMTRTDWDKPVEIRARVWAVSASRYLCTWDYGSSNFAVISHEGSPSGVSEAFHASLLTVGVV